MTGRKRAKDGQVAGLSPEERVNIWFSHFAKLLDNPPDWEDPDEEIPNMFEDLEIDDGLFTIKDYRKGKTSRNS